MLKRTLPLLAALLLLSAASIAQAENPRKLLAQGNKLFAAGNYASAFEVFKQANDTSPSPVFLRSMGFCKLKLAQPAEAHKLFKEYLQKYPKADDRSKIESTVTDLEIVTATKVSIESTPPGAELYFDIEASGKVGTTPFSGGIEPGKHIAILKMPGYRTTTRLFKIEPRGDVSLKVEMEVDLAVSSEPAGATVHLDNVDASPVGKTPYEGGIAPGTHRVYLKAPGFKTFEQQLEVAANRPAKVHGTLQLGLRVASVPAGAIVEIDGTRVEGATPLEIGTTPGKHTITVHREDFKPFTQEVSVAPGQDASIDAQLVGGLLTMRTTPPGAKVRVASLEVGTTPLDHAAVPMGNHDVVIEHPDRRVWSNPLSFSDTEMLTADVRLGRRTWPVWTAIGVAAAGLTVGIIAGLAAKSKTDSANETERLEQSATQPALGICTDGGTPYPNATKADGSAISSGDCGLGLHHTATAGFIAGGVAAVFAVTYWYFFVRPDETVSRQPRDATASAR